MARQDTGIEGLPDEVLTHIFDNADIQSDTLYNTALTSRRLHYFCLPLYLARFHILDPLECCDIICHTPPEGGDQLDALSGLQVALFLPSVKKIVCRFKTLGDSDDYRTVMKHMHRLHEFIYSLSSVEDVTLVFGNQRCGCCSDLDPGETLDDALVEWSQTMGQTLNKILEKSCVSITIIGGRYMGHSYSFKSGKKPVKNNGPLNVIKNLFGKGKLAGFTTADSGELIDVLRGGTWQFNRTSGTGTAVVLTPISIAAKSTSTLQSLTIQSMMFIVPPLLHWVVSVLRLRSVQSLLLMNLSVNRKCWPAVFSLIAENIPHLLELRLSRLRQLNPMDLFQFISRFRHLTSLHIGRDVDGLDSFDLARFPDFPSLISLHAPAGWVFKLLSSQRQGLLCLESLSIVYNLRNDGLSHWLQRTSSPSIPMLLNEQRRPLTISLKVHLGNSPGWKMFEDLNLPSTVDRPKLDDITSLTLILDQEAKSGDMALAQVLPRWTALFYGLRHLSLKSHPRALSAAETMMLSTQIIQEDKIPLLTSVEVNGVEVYTSESPESS
ncbi:hypothetical protein GALMADRAFT_205099 [Galerina marginata CBS 339.88]|uniref:F-box domain-containing protein n=1 Tax=Galerina marginata (strain CBS 339.88) TaxID=685588 RepID=A0A067TTV9_GALM3|nr:hypothetical protein GALMADRAFT_205099 [Galerina marginata CBS 339.88]